MKNMKSLLAAAALAGLISGASLPAAHAETKEKAKSEKNNCCKKGDKKCMEKASKDGCKGMDSEAKKPAPKDSGKPDSSKEDPGQAE